MSHFRFILFGLLTLCLSACPTIAPTITVQPRSLTVVMGSTATFSVTATGSKPFIYQWQKNSLGVHSNALEKILHGYSSSCLDSRRLELNRKFL